MSEVRMGIGCGTRSSKKLAQFASCRDRSIGSMRATILDLLQ